jgi:hypothetical protein
MYVCRGLLQLHTYTGLLLAGLILIYRSKRRGYTFYVIGQMVEISKVFFKTELKMTVIKQGSILQNSILAGFFFDRLSTSKFGQSSAQKNIYEFM